MKDSTSTTAALHDAPGRMPCAASWDQRLDALTALGVLAALILIRWGGLAWRLADPLAGVGVALIILIVGGQLFWSSLNELMDAQASPEMVESMRREALTVPGVRGVEKLLGAKPGWSIWWTFMWKWTRRRPSGKATPSATPSRTT